MHCRIPRRRLSGRVWQTQADIVQHGTSHVQHITGFEAQPPANAQAHHRPCNALAHNDAAPCKPRARALVQACRLLSCRQAGPLRAPLRSVCSPRRVRCGRTLHPPLSRPGTRIKASRHRGIEVHACQAAPRVLGNSAGPICCQATTRTEINALMPAGTAIHAQNSPSYGRALAHTPGARGRAHARALFFTHLRVRVPTPHAAPADALIATLGHSGISTGQETPAHHTPSSIQRPSALPGRPCRSPRPWLHTAQALCAGAQAG